MAIDRCAAQAASARAGGGAARPAGMGAPVVRSKNTDPQKGIVGSHGFTTVWGGITIGYHIREKADSSH